MNVFLFEYATCIGHVPDSIAVEGLGMFNSLSEEFKQLSTVYTLPNELYGTSSEEWMEQFVQVARECEYGVAIAPEDDSILLESTILLDGEVKNLGSYSYGVYTASDKWLSYLKLNKKVNMPVTSDDPLDKPYLIKPRTSCGGEGIQKMENNDSDLPDGYIAQEYVQGEDISVSLLVGDEVRVLSVNKQLVDDFKCYGVTVPFSVGEDVVEEAVKAAESIKGLFGYVGVDIVMGDAPYVVEVNPRITTPTILFRDVYGVSTADLLLKNYEGKEIPQLTSRKKLTLKKVKGEHPDAFLSCSGYSLIKTDTEKN
ncbi:MAG: ATP-grasp domain-containing protein [Archaeoglobaceae archaeon]